MTLNLDINKRIGDFFLTVRADIYGKRVGILGASGSGKSMTLKCIAGIERNDSGHIIFDERVLMDSSRRINLKPQQRRLGYLFQNYALFPTMSVAKNIAAGLSGLPREQVQTKVAEMIRRFRLEGLEDRIPDQLSGGQQQRVAIARIMAYEPGLIMLDEPFSALDGHLKEHLVLEMQEMLRDYDGTVLVVSHNREEIYQLTDEVIVLADGRVVRHGQTRDVFNDPQILAVANLTGCKNISAIEKRGSNILYAKDWDLELQTAQFIADDIRYVGIRAHDLQPSGAAEVNSFPIELSSTVAAPFEIVRLVRKQSSCSKQDIWWKVSKGNLTDHDSDTLPTHLRMPPQSLLLLK